jgi:ribosomal protein L32
MDITNQILLKVKSMDNQVQTIVCPNCGANATNHHNCEYCGSFLVQRASEGKDVSMYVQVAKKYNNQGLASAIKLYSNLLKEHPAEKNLQFIAERKVTLIPDNFDSESDDNQPNTGFSLCLNSVGLEHNGVLGKFRNSPLIQAFNMSNEMIWEVGTGQETMGTVYKLDFGYDYEGASKVVLQLLELFGVNVEESTFVIYDGGADFNNLVDMTGLSASDLESLGLDSSDNDFLTDCLVFNSSGVIIEDYVSFNQSGWQGIEERRKRREEKIDAASATMNQEEKKGRNKKIIYIIVAILGVLISIISMLL